ncbi:MAG: hypothetical protein WKG00_37420 [Polyangiaceae bacterium]
MTTILCVGSFFKGNEFMATCKQEGHHVVLLTVEPLLGKPWAREAIDEVFAVPSMTDRQTVVNAVSYLARTRDITRIAPLDDYDVEVVAHLREHLRIPGMGETTARYFRDKLAMRARAKDRGIAVPEFVHAINYDKIRAFCRSVPAPWLLKPRSEASAVGIKRFDDEAALISAVEALGDASANHLVERMIPGDVFHVDAITTEKAVAFAEVHKYRKPLLEVWTGGSIFATRTVPRGSEVEQKILATHARVVEHLGIVRGVTHTEFILGRDDGTVYFLETAARVGGVHISDLVKASTGVSLWAEWAKIELSQGESEYRLPERRQDYGGLIVTLAKQQVPDTSAYDDPEVVWRLRDNPHHVGLIVRASTPERIEALLDDYEARFARDFAASLPPAAAATA